MVLEDTEIQRLIGGPPRLTLEDIARHPRLPEARKVYLERFLEVYGGDPFLVRLLIESGRFLVCQVTLLLEAAHDLARRETWPTVGLLKENMAMFGLASGRHIDHLISRLCAVGYMELLPSDRDRRVRILKCTEKLRAHDRDWLAAHCAPLAVLYPQHDYDLVMRRDPEFHAVHRRESIQFLPLAAKLLAVFPDTLLFFNHAGGSMVMSALLQAASAQSDYPHAAVPYGDAGARFGISRTQVRKLLIAAEDAGLVRLHARGGRRVEILPRFWSSYDRGLASGMYIHDMAYVAASRMHLTPATERHQDRGTHRSAC
jgi:DNA-binding transcriptional ArsR family regulator